VDFNRLRPHAAKARLQTLLQALQKNPQISYGLLKLSFLSAEVASGFHIRFAS
jgi:hypothetical protein